VDQFTRDDIAAAAAAHSELGRDYDSAVGRVFLVALIWLVIGVINVVYARLN